MLTLTKTSYGFRAVARGTLTVADLARALLTFRRLAPDAGGFGYLYDQRGVAAMSTEVQAKVRELMAQLLEGGVERVAIICSSTVRAGQSNARLDGTPAARFSHAFDGQDPRWRTDAMAWVSAAATLDRRSPLGPLAEVDQAA